MVALITPTQVLVANAGDSRAILIKVRMLRGHGMETRNEGPQVEVTVIPMSKDHTADDPQEEKRVAAAGGTVFEAQQTRQDGSIARVSDLSKIRIVIAPNSSIARYCLSYCICKTGQM